MSDSTDRQALGSASGNRSRSLGALRLVSVWVAVCAGIFWARPSPLSVSIGAVFAVAGEIVRLWAAGYLVKTRELVTSGPYAYTRNPLYLGRLLVFTGLCVMASFPWPYGPTVLAAGWGVFFLYYLPRKERVEPARLEAVHGQAYRTYRNAVPALIPRRPAYRRGPSVSWSSGRVVRNREHWMAVGVALVALLLLWRAYDIRQAELLRSVPSPDDPVQLEPRSSSSVDGRPSHSSGGP